MFNKITNKVKFIAAFFIAFLKVTFSLVSVLGIKGNY